MKVILLQWGGKIIMAAAITPPGSLCKIYQMTKVGSWSWFFFFATLQAKLNMNANDVFLKLSGRLQLVEATG